MRFRLPTANVYRSGLDQLKVNKMKKEFEHELVWQSGLYLVTPNWDDTEHLLAVTEQALQAGVSLFKS